MLEDVEQGVALLWFLDRRPVSNAFDSMSVKKFYGVFTEARQQFSQFSRGRVIDPELVDHGQGLLWISIVLLQSGPK